MAKTALLFLALLTNACTTTTQQRELSASQPRTIVWAPFDGDEGRLRTMIEDRRTWIDSIHRFKRIRD